MFSVDVDIFHVSCFQNSLSRFGPVQLRLDRAAEQRYVKSTDVCLRIALDVLDSVAAETTRASVARKHADEDHLFQPCLPRPKLLLRAQEVPARIG